MAIDVETRAICEASVGRERLIEDSLAPETAAKLATVLGRPLTDDQLPPTWHWAYFNIGIPAENQGYDLHERTGSFLPAAPFQRRMWASGDVTMHAALRLGEPAQQTVRVASVKFKQGRTGEMCFVTVSHRIEQAGRLCIDELRTIVYRDRGTPEPLPAVSGDPVPDGFQTYPDGKLFYYSALTHNGHRIHWDRDFCRDTEGYPDLVVHGPLMATDLCDAMRVGFEPCRFVYRALAPVFVTTPVRIDCDAPGETRAGRMIRADGVTSMQGTVTRM